jgi:hypothetical protein
MSDWDQPLIFDKNGVYGKKKLLNDKEFRNKVHVLNQKLTKGHPET